MLADTRKAYLDELGLTLWRRRSVAGAAASAGQAADRPHPDLPPQAGEGIRAVAAGPPPPLAGEGRGGGAPGIRPHPDLPPQAEEGIRPHPDLPPQAGEGIRANAEGLAPPLAGEGRGGGAPPPRPAVAPPADIAAELAALDWNALEAHLARQDYRGASRAVFGVGARDAELLIVGEAPGAQEDRLGEPFVGRAGKLLDRMLFAIGRDRAKNVYIANICKFRPPNNRDPNAEEVAADRPYLERQIALLAPRLIVAVGRVAAQTLLDSGATLGSLRGSLHHYLGVPVLVTYHPAYLLRAPQHKDRAWADLKRARALLAQAQ